MREVVRSVLNNNTQFAAIEWNENNLYNYKIIMLQSDDHDNLQMFNDNIEALYKKWLVGDEMNFTVKTNEYNWNLNEEFLPTILNQPEKNEYLARKAQKLIQQQFSNENAKKFDEEITSLNKSITPETTNEEIANITNTAKQLDDKIKNAVSSTKNISLEQKWIETGIDNYAYLNLKPKLNELFNSLKQFRANSFDRNYNLISPKVEAAYAQSKVDTNFNETRKDLIALQKELIALPLDRWQKNELMDRLRSAFDHINEKQDNWRSQEDAKRLEQTEALQKQYDLIIPQALNSSFSEGFSLLKDLQDTTNKTSILRDRRDGFYTALDESFKKIKEKADAENEANLEIATKQIDLAIESSKNEDLFKNARQILITAQNDLKEIHLSKKSKDDLFKKIREAFDSLNEEQDAYFKEKRKSNRNQLEDALINLKRILSRKKEGIETLYQTKDNIQAKSSIIKVDKNSDGTIANQFKERLEAISIKVSNAETEIVDLEKKIEKLEFELEEHLK